MTEPVIDEEMIKQAQQAAKELFAFLASTNWTIGTTYIALNAALELINEKIEKHSLDYEGAPEHEQLN